MQKAIRCWLIKGSPQSNHGDIFFFATVEGCGTTGWNYPSIRFVIDMLLISSIGYKGQRSMKAYSWQYNNNSK